MARLVGTGVEFDCRLVRVFGKVKPACEVMDIAEVIVAERVIGPEPQSGHVLFFRYVELPRAEKDVTDVIMRFHMFRVETQYLPELVQRLVVHRERAVCSAGG